MHFNKIVGVIGGGQLGKMMILPANLLGFKTFCYSNEKESPATVFAHESTIGNYDDATKILQFALKCDFITVEFENIPASILRLVEDSFPNKLHPNSFAIYIAQNRLREKDFFSANNIKTVEFSRIYSKNDAKRFFSNYGAFILKEAENGYDGKGQSIIKSVTEIEMLSDDVLQKKEFISERLIDFDFETSVILTRTRSGKSVVFPVPVNIHKNGILHESIVKKEELDWKKRVVEVAIKIAGKLNYVGTLAVEFFVLKDGSILVNEMAPRPHNSGHFSLDLTNVSQFENHIRAVTDLPIITPELLFEGRMLNLIGEEVKEVVNILDKKNVKVHIYGKQTIKAGRKMGHINFIYE